MAPRDVHSDVTHDDAKPCCCVCTADARVVASVDSLVLDENKYWGREPRTLKVSFMENAPQARREKIVGIMNEWDCSVRFELVSTKPTHIGTRACPSVPTHPVVIQTYRAFS
jgi:hypothetical protein